MLKKFKNTIITTSLLLSIFLVSFLDPYVFSFIDLIKNSLLDFVMDWITQLTSTFIVLILMTSLFLWSQKKREWIMPLWISFFATIILGYLVKLIVMRPRPFGAEISFFGLSDYSFPSLHAAASFSAVAILGREYRKIKWFWVVFAVLVCFSRVYIKVHYLSDVVAGAMLGYFVGFLMMKIEEKHHFFKKNPKKH